MQQVSWARVGGLVMAAVWVAGTVFAGPTGVGVTTSVPGVSVSVGIARDGGATIEAAWAGYRFQKTLYSDRLAVRLEAKRDIVIIGAAANGAITVSRGGRSRSLMVGKVNQRDLQGIRSLMAGSEAVAAFRLLACRLEKNIDSEPVESIVISGAMVGLLDGDPGASQRMADRVLRGRVGELKRVAYQRTSGECWDLYKQEAMRAFTDYEECSSHMRWNLIWQEACAFEFTLRAELNWIWLLACVGLPIIQ